MKCNLRTVCLDCFPFLWHFNNHLKLTGWRTFRVYVSQIANSDIDEIICIILKNVLRYLRFTHWHFVHVEVAVSLSVKLCYESFDEGLKIENISLFTRYRQPFINFPKLMRRQKTFHVNSIDASENDIHRRSCVFTVFRLNRCRESRVNYIYKKTKWFPAERWKNLMMDYYTLIK